MNYTIEKLQTPSGNDTADIEMLFEICNNYDNTNYSFDPDDDFKKTDDANIFLLYADGSPAGAASIFAPGKTEAELTVLVSPAYRRNGIFTKLLGEAEKELRKRGIFSILFVCDRNSAYGKKTAEKESAVFEFSEYMMRLNKKIKPLPLRDNGISLDEAAPEDAAKLIEINSSSFNSEKAETEEIIMEFFSSSRRKLYAIRYNGETAGMIGIYSEKTRAYIYGFCIDKKYRGMGIGKKALSITVEKCAELYPGTTVELEVQTDNENALLLYSKSGFETAAVFDYYRKYI